MVSIEGWLVRFVCAACAPTVAHIQSNQILVITAKFGDIIVEFNALDYILAVPALLVHTDIRIAGHAIVWRAIQFARRHATHQLQHVPHCVVDRLSDIDGRRLERGHVPGHRVPGWQQSRNDLFVVSAHTI